ncbi:ORF-18 [Agrotis segetum nucleopolyhedrovirus A]|uniref:ORF-18 n=1 Tax=Agrotis segetum nuclear polyhedrosis virus TaxID=1962501 RepID=Q287Q4_NPVAS|nr:ORF-18 [Agrotis segetum nucleopolyhedrovirus A]AAZ38184.1 ORF-18 [Agrotis segetum nucleopolyhedrovirus A]
MNEISKIEKTENNDISYTKMILGCVVLIALFTLKTKIYRASTCCARRGKRLRSDNEPLENITIQELNYNVTIEHD